MAQKVCKSNQKSVRATNFCLISPGFEGFAPHNYAGHAGLDRRHGRLAARRAGLEFLWRSVVTALACAFIVPIPWMYRWLMQ